MRETSLRHRAGPARGSWFGFRVRLDPWILLFGRRGCQGFEGAWRMLFAAAVLVALPLLAGCATRSAAATVPPSAEETGTIRRVGSFGFAIVPDSDPGTRYAPDRPFPPEFQVDGLRVRFSGAVTDPPEGARVWGTPFRLATLRRADP
jgi:hypothetical protein